MPCDRFPQLCLAFGCLLSACHSPAQGADAQRIPLKSADGHLVVQVFINASGPYDFLLDTGSSVTLVESSLFQSLKFVSEEKTALNTGTRTSSRRQGVAERVAIGGFGIEGVEVLSVDAEELRPVAAHVQGVLGENFLRHFDLLIDNKHGKLILDRTASLEQSMSGDRLAVSFGSRHDTAITLNRLVVVLKIPTFRDRPLRFLVDSGVNMTTFFPLQVESWHVLVAGQPGRAVTLDGKSACRFDRTNITLGRATVRGVVGTCEGLTREKADVDGLLATSLFQRIFISHRGGYILVNPVQRSPAPGARAVVPLIASSAAVNAPCSNAPAAMPNVK